MLQYEIYPLIFLLLINLSIAFLVIIKGPRKKVNQTFFVFILSITIWLIVNALSNNASYSHNLIVIFNKLIFTTTSISGIGTLLFAMYFTNEKKYETIAKLSLGLTVVVAVLASTTNFLVKNIALENNYSTITFGPLAFLYLFLLIFNLIAGLYLLIKKYFTTTNKLEKNQLGYIFFSYFLFTVSVFFTNIILPMIFNNFAYTTIGSFSSVLFSVPFAYAIITKQLFDIRVIISKTLVYSIIITTIFLIYATLIILMAWITQGRLSFSLDPKLIISSITGTIIVGMSYQPITRFLEEKTDFYLFKKRYDPYTSIKDLAQKLSKLINLDEAIKIISQHLNSTLKTNHTISYVVHTGKDDNVSIDAIHTFGNIRNSSALNPPNLPAFIKYFEENKNITLVSTLFEQLQKERALLEKKNPNQQPDVINHTNLSIVHNTLSHLKAEVAIPIYIHGTLISIITLGEKLSGDSFNKDDLEFLEDVRTASVSNIDLAKLYESDQMKSEFISIASHELITPISAMQGYLAMILDEKIGKADKQATNYLIKARASSQRLAQLVKDILTVSRLENGKITFEASPVNPILAVRDSIEAARAMATEKNIELIDEMPAKDLTETFTKTWANYDRIKDIATYLLSNAIHYTKVGSVTVKIEHDKKNKIVVVDIIDTGVGIKANEKIHIFQKFYRAVNSNTTGVVGTGLGLFITKNMVEKMNGNISFHSKEGEGSTFSFSLPVNPPKKIKDYEL